MARHRIGVDLGGTKIEIAALDPEGRIALRRRVATPPSYPERLATIARLVKEAEDELGTSASVGIGIPGVISPATGLVKNANSVALNGHPFDRDISHRLGHEVRVANDANCFALSEATDGAGKNARTVFGIIIGTGCGGG
ncbi:MAG: ROK family protein, partial [Acetobacteraceae bacterium]